MSFEYINKSYGVNACVGRRVIVDGEPGIIVGTKNAHIKVNFDNTKASDYSYCHPVWRVEYLEIGKVRKLTAGQKRYQEYLNADLGCSFAEYLGVDKASREHRKYLKSAGYI